MDRYNEKDFKEALDYYWNIYNEQHLGMLARHYHDVLYEAVDKANRHNKKQKPVKGKIIYNSFENIQTYHCNCGRELSFADNYCGKCGTEINWEEVKNNA